VILNEDGDMALLRYPQKCFHLVFIYNTIAFFSLPGLVVQLGSERFTISQRENWDTQLEQKSEGCWPIT
jgi:hypothetical protein